MTCARISFLCFQISLWYMKLIYLKSLGRKIIRMSILPYWLPEPHALNESSSVGMKKTWLAVVLNSQKVFNEMKDLEEWPVSLFSHTRTREHDIKLDSNKFKAKNMPFCSMEFGCGSSWMEDPPLSIEFKNYLEILMEKNKVFWSIETTSLASKIHRLFLDAWKAFRETLL